MATFEGLMKKDYGDDFENKFVKVKNKILSANKNDKVLIARADAIVETINSGMVVASATIVAPTITWGNLSFFARLDEAVTK